jgi:transcriptional regulator with XRE-family HTH domain
MSDGKTFGQAVREARVAKGMSMGQLAAAVERSTASVRRWEKGEGMPSDTIVRRVLSVLDIDDGDYTVVDAQVVDAAVGRDTPGRVSESMRATSVASGRAAALEEPEVDESPGPLKRFLDPEKPWLGYLRALLTIVTLGLLAWLLLWAAAGLVDAVGEIWQSLWSGSV